MCTRLAHTYNAARAHLRRMYGRKTRHSEFLLLDAESLSPVRRRLGGGGTAAGTDARPLHYSILIARNKEAGIRDAQSSWRNATRIAGTYIIFLNVELLNRPRPRTYRDIRVTE